MNAMRLRKPTGLDNLLLGEPLARSTGAGEIQVRVSAASLNFRDGLVVNGFILVEGHVGKVRIEM